MSTFEINHPSIQSWFFFLRDRTSEILHFQFNPSEMVVDYASAWEAKHAQNLEVQPSTFKSREPKIYKFDLFLNDWGRHDSSNKDSNNKTVEQQIEWLNKAMKPTISKDRKSLDAPPVLIFSWREFEPVILTSMVVKRTHFAPISIKKGLDLTNVQDVKLNDLSGLGEEVSEANKNLIEPGGAIRATASITLREYRESTADTGFSFAGAGIGILDSLKEFFGIKK